MQFPDYTGNNTVNLISSIKGFCGVKSDYIELNLLKSDYLNKYDNVVLFLVDALGYNWLEKYGKSSFLYSKLQGNFTSVFPSTTATAITTINTGYTASEHGIVGRNMYAKELGGIIQILPWKHKISKVDIGDEFKIDGLIEKDNFYKESNKNVFVVTSSDFDNSKYNIFYNNNSKVLKYNDLKTCFAQTLEAINYNKNKKYIHTYWGTYDKLCHDYGIDSKEVFNHFQELDNEFKKLESNLKGTNSLVIVTADHGQLNCPKEINLKEQFKHINDMLLLPLAGEQRYHYCFVKHNFLDNFYITIKNELGFMCDIYTKEEVLKNKLFGFGNNNKFLERIGDFLILPKDGYVLTDGTNNPHVGYHGGLSEWEMTVPLVLI